MRCALGVLSISVGALLLLPALSAVLGSPSELKPKAFQPVLRVPLNVLNERRNLAVKLVLPTDEEIGASDLNDHRYIVVAAASASLTHCWNELGIKVSAKTADRSLAIQNAEGAPYGWSTMCALSGVWFSAAAGEHVELIIEAGSATHISGDLVVLPFLRGVKDRLVGSMINRDITRLSWFTALIGVLLIAAGWLGFRSALVNESKSPP